MAGIDGWRISNAWTRLRRNINFSCGDAGRVTGLPEWSITWKTQHRAVFFVPKKKTSEHCASIISRVIRFLDA